MLHDIDLGIARGEAFERMARASASEDLRALSRAIVQSEELGVSLVGVMQTQSREVRCRDGGWPRQRHCEAPIKMLIPLVIFILPTLFCCCSGRSACARAHAFRGPAMSSRSADRACLVDLYLARGRLRAEIAARFHPVVRPVQQRALAISSAPEAHGLDGRDGAVVRGDLVIRLRDVRLVRPIDEHAPRRSGLPRSPSARSSWTSTTGRYAACASVDRFRGSTSPRPAPSVHLGDQASVRFVGEAEPSNATTCWSTGRASARCTR